MNRVARIQAMEQCLDQASDAMRALKTALRQFDGAQEAIARLEAYYQSRQWKQDFDADEAGRLPADLKRGVLSEDGIWNLLEDVKTLRERCREVGIE
ncbi:MAG: DUF4298 domain-containing protein [Bacteroidaceae bacterium]|nr:DUF4298 domain-containing protein [Bacteroidaceae bacterium]